MNSLRFILDGTIHSPDIATLTNGLNTTLLEYLRSLRGHKGTKEGCAEGDCGACTVVVVSGENGQLKYRAVDSCLVFLPAVHGRQVITVENLAASDGSLHPVQQAMVDAHASQCGFCTPGIVMSLFALYKSPDTFSISNTTDALTGNLCRCTGYNTIISAAVTACKHTRTDSFDKDAGRILSLLHSIGEDTTPLMLCHGKMRYHKPFTLEDALGIKASHPDAIVVSGGTDVALRVTKKHETLHHILDISGIEALKTYEAGTGSLLIGSCLSLEDLRRECSRHLPVLSHTLELFGSRQIRNVATLGGNVASASPIGDTLPLLMVLQAHIHLESTRGLRTVPVMQFITGYRKTASAPDEIISAIEIPLPSKIQICRAYKVSKRRNLDISACSAAFVLECADGIVQDIRMAFGGMDSFTRRAEKTEAFLKGSLWTEANVLAACAILREEYTPISDVRAGSDFRTSVSGNLLIKFYKETLKQRARHEKKS